MTATAANSNPTPEPAPAPAPAPAVPAPASAPHVDPTLRSIVSVLAVSMVLLVAAFLFYVLIEHPTIAQPVQAVVGLLGLFIAGGSIIVTLHTANLIRRQ